SSAINRDNFALASPIAAGTPSLPGDMDSLRVSGLNEGETYHFALRAFDRSGNASEVSNDAVITIRLVSPAATTDLRAIATSDTSVTLRWTASGEDGTTGRATLYELRGANQPISDANFAAAPLQRTVTATVDAGGTETLMFHPLERGKRYWFALKAYDAVDN